jgi:hypothetical protein
VPVYSAHGLLVRGRAPLFAIREIMASGLLYFLELSIDLARACHPLPASHRPFQPHTINTEDTQTFIVLVCYILFFYVTLAFLKYYIYFY